MIESILGVLPGTLGGHGGFCKKAVTQLANCASWYKFGWTICIGDPWNSTGCYNVAVGLPQLIVAGPFQSLLAIVERAEQ